MNVTSTKLGSRRSALQGLALSACLATVLLCGCSLKRSATWDRVTHPDFMYEERTTLHGFHRTSWDSWPEEYRHSGWSRHVDKSVNPEEKLPAGEPSQELPQPEVDEERIEIPEQSDVPEARAPEPRMSKRPPRRPMASTPKLLPSAEAEAVPTVELVAGSSTVEAAAPVIEIPLSLETAPSPWTDRFASLIAEDRKSSWRLLNGQAIELPEPSAPAALVESSSEPLTLERTPKPVLEESTPMSKHGDGAVQFRVPSNAPELELREADDPHPEGDEAPPGPSDHE